MTLVLVFIFLAHTHTHVCMYGACAFKSHEQIFLVVSECETSYIF